MTFKNFPINGLGISRLIIFGALSILFGTSARADELVFNKLQVYCRSCHGVSPMRFFYSEEPGEFMQDLCVRIAPHSKKPWSEQIVRVLSWPSDQAPDPGQIMEPPSRDWMPRGAKRVQFSLDQHENQLTRHLIIEAIRERCQLSSQD